jgi:hypothetical protein
MPTVLDTKRSAPDFGTITARFTTFLDQNKYPTKIVWLMPEDVLFSAKRFLYVRVPIPAANETKARKIYDEAVRNGRGLLISTICEMGASTCCHVWFPKGPEEEPQGLWSDGESVKFSARSEASRVIGKPVKSRLSWAFLKSWHRSKQNLKDFMFS